MMTIQEWGAIGEVIGGLAVLATMLYLAYELRQNTAIERANSQRDIEKQTNEYMRPILARPDLFDVLRQGMADFTSLSPADKAQFHTWSFSMLLLLEQALFMRKRNFIEKGSFRSCERNVLSIIATTGGSQWWHQARQLVSQDAASHIDARLAELGDAIIPVTSVLDYWKIENREQE